MQEQNITRAPQVKNLTGQTFNQLTAVSFAWTDSHRNAWWVWRCVCGVSKPIKASHVKSGNIKSCGCAQMVGRIASLTTHGMSRTRIYQVWGGMVARYEDAHHASYEDYGGRGIRVCQQLRTFEGFFAIVGERPSPELSIDRKDNNGNYSCGQCAECLEKGWEMNWRWATRAMQNRNMRKALMLTLGNETMGAMYWVERTGIKYETIRTRKRLGWSDERILSTPSRSVSL